MPLEITSLFTRLIKSIKNFERKDYLYLFTWYLRHIFISFECLHIICDLFFFFYCVSYTQHNTVILLRDNIENVWKKHINKNGSYCVFVDKTVLYIILARLWLKSLKIVQRVTASTSHAEAWDYIVDNMGAVRLECAAFFCYAIARITGDTVATYRRFNFVVLLQKQCRYD